MKIKIIFFSILFITINSSFAQVIVGGIYNTLVVCSDGTVKSFGNNQYGELGNGTVISDSLPGSVKFLTGITSIKSGQHHSVALKNDSTVWAWGLNQSGGLGDGTTVIRTSPVQTINLSQVISIACGSDHTLALKKDSTLWTWGNNQLTPAKVNSLSQIISIAGSEHSLALKSDGTVWAWGPNGYGQLGDGTNTQRTLPVKVSGLTGIIAIACGQFFSLALKNDGTVWAWGRGALGELGDATLVNKNIPVQVQTLSGIKAIACGSSHTLALKNDGTVWAWGLNNEGQLGNGIFSGGSCGCVTSPAKVIGLSGINEISTGFHHSLAVKNNGTVWSWGYITNGQTVSAGAKTSALPFQIKGLCIVTTPLTVNTSQTNSSCFKASNGSATASPHGGILPYSYLWSNGQTTATATNLSAGTYTLTVTDSVNNKVTSTVTITAGMITSSIVTNVSCNGGNDGSINLSVTGGSGNFSYAWSNGTSNQDINGINAGLYTVRVVDAVCSDTLSNSINIDQPPALLLTFTSTPVTCGKNNGSLSVTTSGGTPPYSYLWSTGNSASTINNLSAGKYTLTITDAHGCLKMKTDSVFLQSPAVSSSISSQTNIQCNPDNNGTATVSVSSGTPGYTYTWSTTPVQTTATATALSAGTYFVTVKDTNGCFNIDTVKIIVLHPLYLTANATATIVFPGTPVTLTGGGATAYSWTGAVNNGIPFIPATTKTYTVTGTNVNGCINQAIITITIKDDHRIIACGGSHSLAICSDGDLKAWGSNVYGGLGDGTTTQRNSPVSVNLHGVTDIAAGLYHSIALTNDGSVWTWGNNDNGELGDGTFIQRHNPVKVINTGVKAIAAGENHSLILKNDGTVWAWGNHASGQVGIGSGGSIPIRINTPVQVLGLTNMVAIAAGYDHSIALKNDGTVWAWGSNGWGQLGNASVVKGIATKVNTLAGIVAIAGGENHTLALKDDGTVWACGINNNGELGDSTNDYKFKPVQVSGLTGVTAIEAGMSHSIALKNDGTVWAWGLNGSSQLGDGTTTNRNIPVKTNITNVAAIEGGAAHSLLLKNNGTLWACGANFAGQIGDGTLIYRMSPVQVTGLCKVTEAFSTTVSQTNNMCSGDSKGSATVIAYGGIAPYTYVWSNAQTSATITNLSAGTYSVTVTDANGSKSINSVTLSAGAVISPNIIHVSCNGGNDGAISLIITEGSGHYSYAWSTGATAKSVNGLTAESYTLTFKDSSCADPQVQIFNINQPAILSAAVVSTPATCGNNNGSATVTAAGGSASYSYLWSTGQTTSSINNLMPGSYTVTVTDNKCGTTSNTISVIPMFVKVVSAISIQTNVSCNGGSNGSATISTSTGTPPYTYAWSTSPVQTTPTAVGLAARTYFVTVTDANGCFSSDSVVITQPPLLPVIAKASATIVLPGTSVTLTGGGATSYTWTGGVTNGISFIPSVTNTYTVTGTDGKGCSNTAKITVTIKTRHHLIAGGNSFSLTLCGDGDVIAWGSNNNGQLGDGTKISKDFPIHIEDITGITDLAPRQFLSLALKKDGTVWTWGNNELTPVAIGGLTGFVDIAGGLEHSLVLKNDGTVWAWGGNSYGELGDSTLTSKFPPVKVKNISGIVSIAAGGIFSLALKDDGTVWSWGYNSSGQLGDGTTISKTVPVQVLGLTNIIAIAAGQHHALALKNDSTVWSWGGNAYGQLGDNTINSRSTPKQVNGLSGISSISASLGNHSVITKSDGTVWAWGLNDAGQLGIGSTTNYFHTPQQVINLTNCKEVAGLYRHTLALKDDGTVWAWGSNFQGALGDSTNIDRNKPVQVIASCAKIVGIEESIADKFSIELFPNPNSGKFTIQHPNNFQKINLEIFNVIGEKISQSEIHNPTTEIDLSNQPDGIYLINLKIGNKVVLKKIIIRK